MATATEQPYAAELYQPTGEAALLDSLADIGPPELDRYRRDGYLAVRSVLTDSEQRAALAGLDALLLDPRDADIQFEKWAEDRLDELDGEQRLDAVRKFMSFAGSDPRLHDLAHDERLLAVMRGLLGTEEPILFQDMAMLKPPGGGREKPWHQDNAYFNLAPGTPIAAAWIALDPATTDNGCMRVIPGSHRDGPVVHFARRDWQICDTDVATAREIAVPLPPGGALFFHGLLQHGTPTNTSPQRRRALQFHYVPAGAVQTDDEQRMAVFGAEGKDVSC